MNLNIKYKNLCNMERAYSHDLKPGHKATVKGWVLKTRDIGNIKFFVLRDREGEIQVTAKKGDVKQEIFDLIPKLNREDCVSVTGEVKRTKLAKMGMEIVPDEVELISRAKTPLPLETSKQIESEKDKRFDFRFLDLRNQNIQAVFRIRDILLTKMREFFETNSFIEVHTPTIQAAGAEGGATLFSLDYYKNKAFLRQSPQLYKQILMASTLDSVYEIGPAFRAEKFHTRRHVSEFLSVDFEMAWINSMEDVLKIIEELIVYTMKGVAKDCKKEFDTLGVKEVKIPETPFKRITYSEAVDILNKGGGRFKWGEDMGDPEEKVVGDHMTKKGHEWYFVTRFPSKIKPFYVMMDGKESHSYDCIYRGMEMASGGQREHRYEELVKVMKEKGLNPRDFKFYLDAFSYGMPPHGGMGFGAERMVQQMLGLENIKEVILFPRTPERLVP
jgi:aspartyl-tRNA synthetase